MPPRIYIDANVFIYAVEDPGSHAEGCRALMDTLRQQPGVGVTSELSLAEVLTIPTSGSEKSLEHRTERFLELLAPDGFIDLVPVGRDVLIASAALRQERRLGLPDALHLATAVRANCDHLVSRDRRLRTPNSITKVEPDRPEMQTLLESLS